MLLSTRWSRITPGAKRERVEFRMAPWTRVLHPLDCHFPTLAYVPFNIPAHISAYVPINSCLISSLLLIASRNRIESWCLILEKEKPN